MFGHISNNECEERRTSLRGELLGVFEEWKANDFAESKRKVSSLGKKQEELRGEFDEFRDATDKARKKIGADLQEFRDLLENGLGKRFKPIFEDHLRAIEEKLKTLAGLADTVGKAAQDAERSRKECAVMKEELAEAAAAHRQWGQKFQRDMEGLRQEAKGHADNAKAHALQAQELVAGCETFLGRLRWLFLRSTKPRVKR